MATWIAHLRVAEKVLEKKLKVNDECFTVGNIGPDSGIPNEDSSSFDPPRDITHWMEDGENDETKENFIYLTENEMNDFIIECSEYIVSDLRDKDFYLENQ